MLFFRKILFPVDFSDHSRGTAPYIADLANRFRASLHLLHVVEGGWNTHKLWRQRELDLAGFAAHLPGGKYLPQSVAYGNPAQAIVRYAETHNIDVIAMPTSGNGMPGPGCWVPSPRRFLIGLPAPCGLKPQPAIRIRAGVPSCVPPIWNQEVIECSLSPLVFLRCFKQI